MKIPTLSIFVIYSCILQLNQKALIGWLLGKGMLVCIHGKELFLSILTENESGMA